MLQLWGLGIAQLFPLQQNPRSLQYSPGTNGICGTLSRWGSVLLSLCFSAQCLYLQLHQLSRGTLPPRVTLFPSSSTIFPPKFLLSLPWVSQPLYRESPLPLILHWWAVNKRCTSVPLVGSASIICISFPPEAISSRSSLPMFQMHALLFPLFWWDPFITCNSFI